MKSKKELAIELQKLKVFEKPKFNLEQYPTNADVAADVLWDILIKQDYDSEKEISVVDLGAGTGILGTGAALLFADKIIFVEKDPEAIKVLKENLACYKGINYEIIEKDIFLTSIPKADFVIMNPPFGTKNENLDTKFLERAFSISDKVYSLHKTSTKEFLKKFCLKRGFQVIEEKDYSFLLHQTMSHHKKRLERVEVSLLVYEKMTTTN